jgi:uncharacterized protein (TIGR02147 family)
VGSKAPIQARKDSSAERPDVYGYHDYLEFLRDWLAFRKASQPGFSMRILAKESELAVGFLPMVLAGKRVLSGKALAKIAPVLGLGRQERIYFELLVTLGTSSSQKVRLDALDRMKRFKAYQRSNPRELEVYQYLRNWYYVAIREMAALPGFRAEADWIQKRLRVPVALLEVKAALDFLLERGFIERATGGTFLLAEKPLECFGGVFQLGIGHFHGQVLELAIKSIQDTPSAERSILGHTVAIDVRELDKAKEILRRALKEIQELGVAQESPDSVYHLEMALFPLTKKGDVS